MALPTSGQIASSQIATEITVPNSNFSFYQAETLRYIDLNALSISSSGNVLDLSAPSTMSEWYGYNHTLNRPCSNDPHKNLKVPINYSYSTFAQIDLGTTSGQVNFSGSNFTTSGNAPEAFVSYSAYYTTYSISMPSNKIIKSGVLKASSPSDSLTYNYNASSGSIVTWLWTNVNQSSIVYDAQYIVVTYTFNTGLDLDTRTRIVTPDVGQTFTSSYLGWQGGGGPGRMQTYWPTTATLPANGQPLTGSNRPYLIWGGDNQGVGSEAVLLDIGRFKELNPSANSIVLDLRAFWFVTIGTTPVILDVNFYTGSYMVRNGTTLSPSYNFTYMGSNPSANLASKAKTITAEQVGNIVTGSSDLENPPVSAPQTRGQRAGVLTYNLTNFTATLNTLDTTTPFV